MQNPEAIATPEAITTPEVLTPEVDTIILAVPAAEEKSVEAQPSSAPSFLGMGISDKILKSIQAMGYTAPTPIQSHAIPVIMTGKDVIAQAKTGSGKTAAFCVPTLSRLKFDRTVEILVLCPTRELATQVADEAFELGKEAGIKTVAVVGGQHIYRQVELINRGVHLVAATPGRLMDHMREGRLKNFTPKVIVLDEADEMLDMGFIDDIRSILSDIPSEGRQTLLFSATMPPAMRKLAQEFMKDPHSIKLNVDNVATDSVEQRLYVAKSEEKVDALIRLIDVENPEKFLVFCRTKADVDGLSESLQNRGIQVHALHGDISQNQRTSTVNSLSEGRIRCVIATDVAARGLDIPGLTHVINMNVPEDRQRYIHRIGRTGRATKKGVAITIASPQELRRSATFNKQSRSEFSIHQIPDRKAAMNACSQAMLAEIEAAPNNDDWLTLASTLIAREAPEDLILKLLSMLGSKKRIRGGDRIGFSVDHAEKLFDNSRSSGGRDFGNRRPRFEDRGGGRPGYFKSRRPESGGEGSRQGSSYGRNDRGFRSDGQAPARKPWENRDARGHGRDSNRDQRPARFGQGAPFKRPENSEGRREPKPFN
jgi:ATP-dependent RNA helicase DeaD